MFRNSVSSEKKYFQIITDLVLMQEFTSRYEFVVIGTVSWLAVIF